MRVHLGRFAIAVLIGLALPSICHGARDDITYVPLGWELDPLNSPYDLSPNGMAFVVYQYDDERRVIPSKSLVVQTEASTTLSSLEFQYYVTSLKYSPDGRMLIVHQWTPEHKTGEWLLNFRVSAIDPTGELQWAIDNSAHLRFSTTGQVLYTYRSKTLVLFDLSGERITEIDLSSYRLYGALPEAGPMVVVVGTGEKLIVADGRDVVCLKADSGKTEELWRMDVASSSPAINNLRYVSNERFVVSQDYGQFSVVDLAGNLLHTHYHEDNVTDRCGKRIGFSSPFVHPGLTPECLLLFDGDELGMSINLDTGEVGRCKYPVCRGKGCVTRRKLAHGRLVIMYPTQIRVRPLRRND